MESGINRRDLIRTAVLLVAATALGVVWTRLIQRRGRPAILIENLALDRDVVVDVLGAVATPGVYRLDPDSRLQDAIDAAGGLTDQADLSSLNPARRLSDEERFVVPSRSDAALTIVASPRPVLSTIDINTADANALDALPGVGPVIAQRIVDYRDANGPFGSIQELALVEGVSARMVTDLRELITAK